MLIYLSGPITKPDPNANANAAIRIADALVEAGFTPIVPQLSVLWQTVQPHDWQWWIDYDLRIVESCDLIVRIPGESRGADFEMSHAYKLGKSHLYLDSTDPGCAVGHVADILKKMSEYSPNQICAIAKDDWKEGVHNGR